MVLLNNPKLSDKGLCNSDTNGIARGALRAPLTSKYSSHLLVTQRALLVMGVAKQKKTPSVYTSIANIYFAT